MCYTMHNNTCLLYTSFHQVPHAHRGDHTVQDEADAAHDGGGEDVYKRQVQTHNTDLKKRLTAFAAKYPQCCRQTDDDEQGGLTFEIEKGRLSFRLTAPYSEERRRAASEQAKQNGIHKKVADLP